MLDRNNIINNFSNNDNFNFAGISIASPEKIKSWSSGEVKNPETINYRSLRPEKGGLFCEKIFGPTKDFECGCGKYKGIKYKKHICDRCGVQVISSKSRRERIGYIDLATPVSHIWFFKSIPSKLNLLLDIGSRDLERVIYYEGWLVIDPKNTNLKKYQILSNSEREILLTEYDKSDFDIEIGAFAIQKLLKKLDLQELESKIRLDINKCDNKILIKKLTKKLKLVESLINSKSRPEWMILDVLPIIPPDLRPLVQLEGGKFATSDLNDLYRKIIYRNNRLKYLLKAKAPGMILRNERRMLQESVDSLFDNGRHGKPVTGSNNRPLKSLSEMLKGKAGRFRQNLLGKRVDYSGRSVIVVGPELQLSQCGIPKKMALTLFEPFVIAQLRSDGHTNTIRGAKKIIENGDDVVWDILEKVTKGHPVLLNRAPTLHRLGIQAFDPILIEGSAIRIHPLVCAAYNADFDGDQMAVHVPLSDIAKIETKLLINSTRNIFSPSNGKPITTPSQDIVLGAYYLTLIKNNNITDIDKIRKFSNFFELLNAYEFKQINIHDSVCLLNPDYGKNTIWGNNDDKFLITTVGRCIFNEIWPDFLGFYNKIINKKSLNKMISDCYSYAGHDLTVDLLDKLKSLSYEYVTRSGFSISIADLKIPESKDEKIKVAKKNVDVIKRQYESDKITKDERTNKVIDIWNKLSNDVANELINTLREGTVKEGEINPLFAMLDSGSRGSKDQIRQLAAMRGLMAKPSGDIIETPILSNFREGLNVAEYFISTHGARKGLADTALKTAESGYMTRRLIDVSQDIICTEEDCGTIRGIRMVPLMDGKEEIISIKERIIGRYSSKDIIIKGTTQEEDTVIVKVNEYISEQIASRILNSGINEVFIRSPLTCESKLGICIKCYGINLATNDIINEGDPIGIIAAQSIGEPGTQLTMRTFHIGGTASSVLQQNSITSKFDGKICLSDNIRLIKDEDENQKVIKEGNLSIIDPETNEELDKYQLFVGSTIFIEHGEDVKVNDLIAKWDPFNVPIISEISGRVEFKDIKKGVNLTKDALIIEKKGKIPTIIIKDLVNNKAISRSYYLRSGTHIVVKEKEEIKSGIVIATLPRSLTKNKDITGGLPRVAGLFEARSPKEIAKIAEISGKVEIIYDNKEQSETNEQTKKNINKSVCHKVIIRDTIKNDIYKEISIPINKRLMVKNGDIIRKGQKLTDGSPLLHDLLAICGIEDAQRYIIDEIQSMYKNQGVDINDKHIEVIVRKMFQKVQIIDSGSTKFTNGEQVDKNLFNEENDNIKSQNGIPAKADPILLGITKASLETDSFISAASFQNTTRILTDAATLNKIDNLYGFKENVITGHVIPAGTGSAKYKKLILKKFNNKQDNNISSEENLDKKTE